MRFPQHSGGNVDACDGRELLRQGNGQPPYAATKIKGAISGQCAKSLFEFVEPMIYESLSNSKKNIPILLDAIVSEPLVSKHAIIRISLTPEGTNYDRCQSWVASLIRFP